MVKIGKLHPSGFVVGLLGNGAFKGGFGLIKFFLIKVDKTEIVSDFSIGGSKFFGFFENNLSLIKEIWIKGRKANENSSLGFVEI